jgi:hypothetical protein
MISRKWGSWKLEQVSALVFPGKTMLAGTYRVDFTWRGGSRPQMRTCTLFRGKWWASEPGVCVGGGSRFKRWPWEAGCKAEFRLGDRRRGFSEEQCWWPLKFLFWAGARREKENSLKIGGSLRLRWGIREGFLGYQVLDVVCGQRAYGPCPLLLQALFSATLRAELYFSCFYHSFLFFFFNTVVLGTYQWATPLPFFIVSFPFFLQKRAHQP